MLILISVKIDKAAVVFVKSYGNQGKRAAKTQRKANMSIYLLMGNEALGIGAVHAGVNFAAGYPGTPSTEVLETIAKKNDGSIHVEWSTNEKVALEAAIGAAMAGARSLVTMKQVGLNVAADPLMTASYLGCKGALVLVVADDPGPISSQTEQDTREFARFAKVPVLDPVSAGECYGLVQDAFEISEKYHTPVIVRPTTRVCHACGTVKTRGGVADCAPIETFQHPNLEDSDAYWQQFAHVVSGFERDVNRWVVFPKTSRANHAKIEARANKIADEYSCEWHPNRIEMGAMPHVAGVKAFEQVFCEWEGAFRGGEHDGKGGEHDAGCGAAFNNGEHHAGFDPDVMADEHHASSKRFELGIACGGITYHYVKEALEMSQVNVPVLKVGMPYPFPEILGCKLLKSCKQVLVAEELDPVIERELLFLCGKHKINCEVNGKLSGHFPYEGEQSVEAIISQLEQLGVGQATHDASDSLLDELKGESNILPSEPLVESYLLANLEPPEKLELPEKPELPARPPVLCAGCPHRASFYAVKQAVLSAISSSEDDNNDANTNTNGSDRITGSNNNSDGASINNSVSDNPQGCSSQKRKAIFCGDIGCYTLGNAAPLDMVDTCVCMGAGLTIAQGIKAAEDMAAANIAAQGQSDVSSASIQDQNPQNIDSSAAAQDQHLQNTSSKTLCFGFSGDSTFFASGIPGVVNALYNKHDIIICILDNSITAMTGQQPHPGTGQTLMNTQSEPLSIPKILDALGVANTTVNPFNQKQARQAVQNAINMTGVRAIIFKAPCIYLAKNKRHALEVNAQKCTTCYKCIDELGCPALSLKGEQVSIEASLCTGCTLCAQVCPDKAISAAKASSGERCNLADGKSSVSKSGGTTKDGILKENDAPKDDEHHSCKTRTDKRGQHE